MPDSTGETSPFARQLDDATRRGYVAALRMLGNAEDARDACQDAAAKAWAARDRFDGSQQLYPWYYRILKNRCLDLLRRQASHRGHDDDVRDVWSLSSTRPEGLSGLIRSERETALLGAVQRLSVDHREIIELRHFQDLAYEEIADVLECAVGTVMSRLYRARKALWNELREQPEFQEGVP